MTTPYVVVTGAVLAGYLLGRARPLRRVRDEAHMFLLVGEPRGWARLKVLCALATVADRVALACWGHWRDRRRRAPQPVVVIKTKDGGEDA